jgi:hypothetical protein
MAQLPATNPGFDLIAKRASTLANDDDLQRACAFVDAKFKTIEGSLKYKRAVIDGRPHPPAWRYETHDTNFLSPTQRAKLSHLKNSLEAKCTPLQVGRRSGDDEDLDAAFLALADFLSSMPRYPNEEIEKLMRVYFEDLITKLPLQLIPNLLRKVRQGEYGAVTKRPLAAEIITWGEKELIEARGLLHRLDAVLNCAVPASSISARVTVEAQNLKEMKKGEAA